MRLDESDVQAFIEGIHNHALIVQPQRIFQAVNSDPDDDRVIECAVAADAEWIVSGDKHLLTLGSFNNIQIVTTAIALQILDGPA